MPCETTSCSKEGKNCGVIPDGCGGTLDCGTCPEGTVCGAMGPNRCGMPPAPTPSYVPPALRTAGSYRSALPNTSAPPPNPADQAQGKGAQQPGSGGPAPEGKASAGQSARQPPFAKQGASGQSTTARQPPQGSSAQSRQPPQGSNDARQTDPSHEAEDGSKRGIDPGWTPDGQSGAEGAGEFESPPRNDPSAIKGPSSGTIAVGVGVAVGGALGLGALAKLLFGR